MAGAQHADLALNLALTLALTLTLTLTPPGVFADPSTLATMTAAKHRPLALIEQAQAIPNPNPNPKHPSPNPNPSPHSSPNPNPNPDPKPNPDQVLETALRLMQSTASMSRVLPLFILR